MLRQRLLEIVLITTACDGGRAPTDAPPTPPFDPCQTPSTIVEVVSEPPPAELLELVRACERDAVLCDDLCRRILVDEMLAYTELKSCAVQHAATEHTVTVGYCFYPAEGRRPPGLVRQRRKCASVVGAHLARGAFYEAASVHAFVQLARELRRHRAPRRLVAAVRRSAAEEIVHARLMTGLLRGRGVAPPPLVVKAPHVRSIEAIAIENAREGLVGETWSAITALWQARHARDAGMRAVYARIAEDEVRHAELAIAIDRWARGRLGSAARARVDAARTTAVRGLARQVRRARHPELVAELGMPDRVAAQRLFEEMSS